MPEDTSTQVLKRPSAVINILKYLTKEETRTAFEVTPSWEESVKYLHYSRVDDSTVNIERETKNLDYIHEQYLRNFFIRPFVIGEQHLCEENLKRLKQMHDVLGRFFRKGNEANGREAGFAEVIAYIRSPDFNEVVTSAKILSVSNSIYKGVSQCVGEILAATNDEVTGEIKRLVAKAYFDSYIFLRAGLIHRETCKKFQGNGNKKIPSRYNAKFKAHRKSIFGLFEGLDFYDLCFEDIVQGDSKQKFNSFNYSLITRLIFAGDLSVAAVCALLISLEKDKDKLRDKVLENSFELLRQEENERRFFELLVISKKLGILDKAKHNAMCSYWYHLVFIKVFYIKDTLHKIYEAAKNYISKHGVWKVIAKLVIMLAGLALMCAIGGVLGVMIRLFIIQKPLIPLVEILSSLSYALVGACIGVILDFIVCCVRSAMKGYREFRSKEHYASKEELFKKKEKEINHIEEQLSTVREEYARTGIIGEWSLFASNDKNISDKEELSTADDLRAVNN